MLFSRFRMEYINFLQIISQVFPFVWPEYPQRKTDECPQVNNRIVTTVMFAEFMNLCMTVMTTGNAIIRTRCLDLVIFQLAICQTLFLETGLQKPSATAATVIVGFIGLHINEIFLTHN